VLALVVYTVWVGVSAGSVSSGDSISDGLPICGCSSAGSIISGVIYVLGIRMLELGCWN
jgi:hypothetical protein